MPLSADLSLRLDGSTAQASLTGDLGNVGALLDVVNLPLDVQELGDLVSVAEGIDLSSLEASAAGLAAAVGQVVEDIPGVGPELAAATDLLEVAAVFADADLQNQLQSLLDRLSAEVDFGAEGPLAALEQLAETFKGAGQANLLKRLYGVFVSAGGAPDLNAIRVPDLLPGLAAAIRAIGSLMSLETLLQDAERLAAAAARELDLEALQRREQELLRQLAALPALVASLDVADMAAVEPVARAIAETRLKFEAQVRAVSEGMGFAEATLVYIDFARLRAESQQLLGALRGEDLSAAERAVSELAAKLGPLFQIDLSTAPRFSLDDLLSQVEDQVGDLADRIDSADLSVLTDPLQEALSLVTRVPEAFSDAIGQVNVAVASALGSVSNAVSQVPVAQLGDALRTGASALGDVLSTLGEVLETVEATVGEAAGTLQTALQEAENAVDTFVATLDALFGDAADFVDGLGLDGIAGTVSDNVSAFADLIAKADLAPYFTTASDAIDSTAGVIEKVPFALLPDSMEQEVVDVARPIKQTDLTAFRGEILNVLQIDEEGGFSLRPELEASLAQVQAKVDALLEVLREHDPRTLVGALGPTLDELRGRIEGISPQVELGRVREALDTAKATITALDPEALLAPVNQAFDQVLAGVDGFSPDSLLDELESRIDGVRTGIIDALKLRQWRDELDTLQSRILGLLELFDLSNLEEDIATALTDLQREVANNPRLRAFDGLGAVVASLLGSAGGRRSADAFEAVMRWLTGQPAAAALEAHTAAAMQSVATARSGAEALDPMAMASRLTPALAAIDAAISLKAEGAGKLRLEAATRVNDPIQALATIGANRSGYLSTLDAATTAAGSLRDLALDEVDTAAARLRGALAPLAALGGLLRSLGEIVGMPNALSRGLPGILEDLLASAPPERLTALLTPVYLAIRGRLEDLLSAVLDPLRQAIDELLAALEAVNLDALRAGLESVHAQVRSQIESLRPDAILSEALAAFADARAAVQAFDPLGDVLEALEAVKASALSVSAKLDPRAMVATPQAIFDDILQAFEALRVGELVAPLLDQLDGIAAQVDSGLEDTVGAFRRLQDALPDRIGSTSLTVSASASVG